MTVSSSLHRRVRGALVLLCVLLCPHGARASPLFELYGDVQEQGGFNARVSSPSAASVYFNPALLPRAKHGLSTGSFVGYDAIEIALSARSPRQDLTEAAMRCPPSG
jgi:hypothetical protein